MENSWIQPAVAVGPYRPQGSLARGMLVFLCGLILLAGLSGISGALLKVSWLQAFGNTPPLPVPISVGLVMLGAGMLLLYRNYQDTAGLERWLALILILLMIPGSGGILFMLVYLSYSWDPIYLVMQKFTEIPVSFVSSLSLALCTSSLLLFLFYRHLQWVSFGIGIVMLLVFNLQLFALVGFAMDIPVLYDTSLSLRSSFAYLFCSLSLLIATMPYGGVFSPLASNYSRVRWLAALCLLPGLGVLLNGIYEIYLLNSELADIVSRASLEELQVYFVIAEFKSVLLAILITTVCMWAVYFLNESHWYADQMRQVNEALEERVEERTAELTESHNQLMATNKELEAFSYSVSHDLRTPLRSIDGFSQALLEDYESLLDEQGRNFLGRIRASSQRMALLIDDMLSLARLTRTEMQVAEVDMACLAGEIMQELREQEPDRQVRYQGSEMPPVDGDALLLRAVLQNLLGNAWKFTRDRHPAEIIFGAMPGEGDLAGKTVYFVRDNGVGFDMQYAGKLFGAFQRLHGYDEYSGTGIGLATVQRIIHRHGGRVWAEAETGLGATFYFTLSSGQERETV